MSEIAAIDCGTNSIKLLIGDLPAISVRESRMVRLGQGVDATGSLADEALARTFAAVDEYAGLIRAHGVDSVRFCATSATRDARNADVFTDGVRERLGVTPEVLSGDDEAALVFAGATRTLRRAAAASGAGGRHRRGFHRAGARRRQARRRHVDGHRLRPAPRAPPPRRPADQRPGRRLRLATSTVTSTKAPCPLAAARSVVGTSGTVKTLAAAMLELPFYDRDAIDGAVLGADATRAYVERLVAMTVAERRAIPSMHPGRADVIGAGALIWSRVLAGSGVESYRVSEADILYGIAWSLVDEA